MKVDTREFATVIFAQTSKYLREGLQFDDRQLFYNGTKEVIVESNDYVVLDKIFRMRGDQDTFFPRIRPIKRWLDKEGIAWFEENAPGKSLHL